MKINELIDNPFWEDSREFSRFEAYLYLLTICDNKGVCSISHKNICDKTGWSRGKVRHFIESLSQLGLATNLATKPTTILKLSKSVSYKGQQPTQQPTQQPSEDVNWEEVLNSFNKLVNRKFKTIPDKAKKQVKARIKEGYNWLDFKKAIRNIQKDDYHIETNFKYLTLEYVSRATTITKFTAEDLGKKENIYDQ